jgi:polynucleotide 5'-kinase involved in rRNA processing
LREWHGRILNVDIPKGIKKVPRHIRKEIRESRWKKAFKGAQERQVDLEEKRLLNTCVLSGDTIDPRIFRKLLQCKVFHAEEIPEGFFIIKKDIPHEYPPRISIAADTLKMLDAGWEEQLVVGLARQGQFVDIGIVKRINYKTMVAVISCKEYVFDTIKFGRIKVDESGSELGFIDWC